MNLIIDIGNSTAKTAVFEEDRIVETRQMRRISKKELENVSARHAGIEKCILSSVRKEDPGFISLLKESFRFCMVLDHRTRLPIRNLYRSKSTLGYDRIAAAVAANFRFPGRNILVIDAGTAITIDFVSADNTYRGGNISPGLNLRFRALNEFTDNLPLLEPAETYDLVGRDTDGAIVSGVLMGIVFELDRYIDEQKKRYTDLKVILTGGDAKVFDKKLKKPIFVDSDLNLFGLHRILEYNADR